MRLFPRLALAVLPGLLPLQPRDAAAAVQATQPTPPGQTTYSFSGVCDDCAGTATGTLTLLNYTRGATVTADNFVSFRYDGTNLIPGGFTIINDADLNVGGSISDPLPGTEPFYVYGTMTDGNHQLFETFANGFWCTGYSCIQADDEGFAHTWAASAATAVPEPMSLVLLGGGVLGVVAARRRA